MAAELRLNVSLDLGFFRQQLQKLTVVAQSEFTPKLNVKFNRSTLDKELNNLQSAIKRRVYRIEIGGNIDAFPDKIASIRRELAALETQKEIKIPITVENGVTKKDSSAVVASIRRSIREDALEDTGNKIRIPVSITPSITQKDVADFKKAVKESLGGISVDVKAKIKGGGFAGSSEGAAGLMEFMRTQGMVGKTASGMEMRMRNEPGAGKIQRTALDQLARAILFMAGIDPAQIRQAQAERRRIPNIDFNPTVPPRSFSIGPSSTGRALPPGAIAKGLPGTAFGAQKYLPTALGEELKQILRGAANAFVDAVKQNIRSVKITDLGAPVSRQGLLGGRTTAGFLPAGVGRVPGTYSTGRLGREGETREQLFARREREARMRSALRGVDIMGAGPSRIPAPYSQSYRAARPTSAIVPYAAPGALVAQGGGAPPSRGTGGPFGGRPGGPGGMQFNMPNLPGSGIVRELGEEFSFAAKQVLLFGTAYKALAFIQTFPAQVGEAVGALQSFRNTIGEISPTAKEAAASSQFILDIVDKYNVPLQSARDGFVKLYASMQPAGFSGDEIRDLFLGISQTAATFGMSADKVDRVNYAFAQMASKGQVMSEELKGQLGDVLPGAMAIFAEAAGFKGPEAISKFSEALEDGVYKGGAMKTLLTNVGVIMRQEFGPGAEGAARTFQGVMNRMQNSTKLLYESFEPVAVGFLNAVVMPMTNGIKTITDGFNAFFTGTAAKTAGGLAFAQELERLRPSFEGIAQNIQELLPLLQTFGSILLNVGKTFVAIAGNPITGFLLKVYGNVLLVNTVFTLLGGKILVNLIASISTAIGRFIALNLSVATLQRTSVATNSTLAGTQLQMALLSRNAVSATGPLTLLRNTLASIASFGVIAVAVTIAVSGLQETIAANAELAKLRGRRNTGGAAAMLQGATKEEVERQKIIASKAIKNEEKKLEQLNTPVSRVLQQLNIGGVLKPLGVQSIVGASEQRQLARARIESAKSVMGVSTEGRTSEVVAMPGTVGTIPGAGAANVGSNAKKAASDAKKTASEAARQAEQLMGAEMQLNLARQLFAIENRVIAARFEGNKPLELARETQKELAQIAGEAAAIKADKDMPAARKLVELDRLKVKSAEAARALAVDIAQIEIDRNKSFDQIIADLDLELALKRATTEQAREQLRIEAERARLQAQLKGLGLPQSQIDEAMSRQAQLATTETPTQKIYSQMQKDLQDLVAIENVARDGAKGIGDAFGVAFQSILSGSASAQEALAGMMKSIGENFLSMAAQIIAQQITMIIFGTIMKALGVSMPGGGGGGGGFGGAPSAPAVDFGFTPSFGSGFAKGGVFHGGQLNAYAKGGIVDSPTFFKFANGGQMANGLMGEAGPEAIMPLKRGADGSLGVEANGLRDAMDRDRYSNGGGASILNMSFESTTIGGVEYVSRDQLEQAMAETRRNAARDGAQRGMSMTLDRIQNSSSTRRRIGV